MEVWHKKLDFKNLLLKNKNISKYLNTDQIESLFDISKHTKNISYIFNRVFK